MSVEDLIIYGKKYIHTDIAHLLLSENLNLNSLELLEHLNDTVNSTIVEKYKQQIDDLRNNKPIQYVIGNVNFYGYKINVNENVLIPRFETEELIEKTIKHVEKTFDKQLDILDLGTGSGCISIVLKKKLKCNVDAVDISAKSLEIAKLNAEENEVDINFIQSNMLENVKRKYDIVISNPPYISTDEEIMDIVKNNEPHLALYADNNGLYYYENILENIHNYLNDKFIIAFEIGYKQGNDIKNIVDKYFSNVYIYIEKDLQNKDRFLFIIKD